MKFSTILMGIAAAGLLASANAQLAKGGAKFLGNITTNGAVRSDMGTYWNQITAENECKWGSINTAENEYNWSGCDAAYNWAKQNGAHFKFHALVWGSQYPGWITSLSADRTKEVIEKWMKAVADHYEPMGGLEMIDVVNEAIQTGDYSYHSGYNQTKIVDALGGDLKNGQHTYKFVSEAFKMARKYFPNSILIYNDYNTIRWDIDKGIDLVKKIKADGAPIDAYGQQAHDITGMSKTDFEKALTKIHDETGLPIYITEYDVGYENDEHQKTDYSNHIPFLWETEWIAGITLWGYISGATWINVDADKSAECNRNNPGKEWKYCNECDRNNDAGKVCCSGCSGLINNNTDRAAMAWLKEYFRNHLADGKNSVDFSAVTGSSTSTTTTSSASTVTTSSSSAAKPLTPYDGKVANVPGKIEVEYFDEPSEGNETYYDKSEGNAACQDGSDSECSNVREGTDVDLKKAASGVAIGWFQTGEWLEYTVNAEKEGTYTLYVAAASQGGGSLKFTVKDASGKVISETDDIAVAAASSEDGAFNEYAKTAGVSVKLAKGVNTIRMECTQEYLDVDYFNLAYGEKATDNAKLDEDVKPTYTSVEEVEKITSSSSEKKDAIFTNRLNLRSNTLEDYDVFDMQGNFMGRMSAYSMSEAFSMLKGSSAVKMNGTYFLRNKMTGYSKAVRIVK